jgi:hypothetical protein
MKTPNKHDFNIFDLMEKWPVKIQLEIAEHLECVATGHGSHLSKPAQRRWRYLMEKLNITESRD